MKGRSAVTSCFIPHCSAFRIEYGRFLFCFFLILIPNIDVDKDQNKKKS